MNARRRFFKFTVAAAFGSLAYGFYKMPLFAQMKGHHMSTGSMPDMGEAALPDLHMPKGEPLKPLSVLKNEATSAGRFVAKLAAAETKIPLVHGKAPTSFWLYNKGFLPLIEVNIGDELVITFDNRLPQEGTIHWHGLSIPPEQDGNPHDAVPSGKSRQYRFTVTADMAGTHWFHPHTHEKVAEQVYRGLAGALIVKDPKDPLKDFPEQHLFFSDLRLDENAQIPKNTMMHVMNGREGQFALVNGQWQPKMTLAGTQRLRLWNGNSARYLDLQFPSKLVDAYWVASEGGLFEAPQKITSLLLTPGERAEVVITPKVASGKFDLIAKAYNREKMGSIGPDADLVLASVAISEGKKTALPKKLRTLPAWGEPTEKKRLAYSEKQMNFYINGRQFDMHRIDLKSKICVLEEWEIVNNSHMDHNFHLHGTHFLVKNFELSGKKRVPGFVLLKDTVNLKPNETVRILTRQMHKGIRMYHCHILEHENAGMMGQLEVV